MNDMEKLQEAVEAVAKHGTIADAARHLGIPRKTLSDRYNRAQVKGIVSGMPKLDNEHSAILDAKFKKLTTEKRAIQTKYNHLLTLFENNEKALETIGRLHDKIPSAKPMSIKVSKRGGVSESTAVILCSDLHYEETVDPNAIDGLNEYSPAIAEKRFGNFIANSMKLVDMARSTAKVDKLVLWLGGDFLTGYIHEELMETNAMSPVEASIKIYELLVGGIDFILEHGDFKQIVVPCNVGNHSRTTKEYRVSTAVQNNYEHLIFSFLETHYKDDDRITFNLTMGYFNYLDVYGYQLRFHHGNNVRYGGGIGGLTIPLNKAIAMWNQAKPAYLDIMGHWHQRMSSNNFVVNGSIIGYNAYALSIKASFERPQQTFFLMHQRWGKTVEAPIFVD